MVEILSAAKQKQERKYLGRQFAKRLWLVAAMFPLATASMCSKSSPHFPIEPAASVGYGREFALDISATESDLAEIARAPHPFGSPRQKEVADWLTSRIASLGGGTIELPFHANTPNPQLLQNPDAPANLTISKSGRNILAIPKSMANNRDCLILLGSHYDSKHLEGIDYLGANDSGSSSVLLLQILAHLEKKPIPHPTRCQLGMIWFDGEEAILPEWSDGERLHPAKIQDNTYGSRDFVNSLSNCKFDNQENAKCVKLPAGAIPVLGLVLVDMIGSPNLNISLDGNSTAGLRALLVDVAAALGQSNLIDHKLQTIEDDHMPFLRHGIPAIDIIDFNNLRYWHKGGDNPGTISMESIEIAGQISLSVALSMATTPQAYLNSSDP